MQTFETLNGQTYLIATSKGYNKELKSYYHKVSNYEANGSFTWDMFGDPSTTLISEKCARVTENAIKLQHAKALLKFDEVVRAEQEAKPIAKPIEIGSYIFQTGYGMNIKSGEKYVYKIEGRKVYFIDIETLELGFSDFVRHETNIFGIGTYYTDKVYNNITELNNFVIDAKEAEEAKFKADQEEKEQENSLYLQAIEEGKKILNIPNEAKAVIIAEYYINESDSQTDYFSARVSKKIYLGFSDSTRNNERELQKHCVIIPETAEFKDTKAEKTCLYYLPSYYIGDESIEGWKVSKEIINFDHQSQKDILFAAAANGNFIQKEFLKTIEEIEPLKIGNIEIVDYSEKAIAVIGDTKDLKDYLKELGGRFNFRLSCGPGWIFPKTKEQQVKDFLSVEA